MKAKVFEAARGVQRTSSFEPHQQGFSLVEILVGIVIGMVGLLVIFKTVAIWDNHTRTTVSGGDAQVAGTLAMFNLERDIKQAGMGFGRAASGVMGCTVTGVDTQTSRNLTFPLRPIEIAEGAGGGPDTLTVLAGNSSFFVENARIVGATPTVKQFRDTTGLRQGDVAVLAPASGAACELIQITDNSDSDRVSVSHSGVGSYVPDVAYQPANPASALSPRYNVAAGTTLTYVPGGTLFNLGSAPQRNVWSITSGRVLSRVDEFQGTAAVEVSDGVINMKAQYGVDANNDNVISDTEWVITPAPVDWTRVRAVRVALLVRSTQFEKPVAAASTSVAMPPTPTSRNPTWAGGDFVMTNVSGTADTHSDTSVDPDNWRFYRYRVYEKVIPLRNMIWGNTRS
jgi:type IV pilus assembly protein PilW